MAELHVDIDNAAQCALSRLEVILREADTAREVLLTLDAAQTAQDVEERMQALDARLNELRLKVMECRGDLGRMRVCIKAGKICGLLSVPDPEQDRTQMLASLHRAGDRTLDDEEVLRP